MAHFNTSLKKKKNRFHFLDRAFIIFFSRPLSFSYKILHFCLCQLHNQVYIYYWLFAPCACIFSLFLLLQITSAQCKWWNAMKTRTTRPLQKRWTLHATGVSILRTVHFFVLAQTWLCAWPSSRLGLATGIRFPPPPPRRQNSVSWGGAGVVPEKKEMHNILFEYFQRQFFW